MMGKKTGLTKDKLILVVLIFFLATQIIVLSSPQDIWWDSSVYLGMGRFIYSFGESGLWEASRPLVLPIILGFFWKLNLNPILFGKLTIMLLGAGCVLLTYIIAKKIFNAKTAFLSSIFLAFSPTFYLFTTVLQTEIPSLFFVLLGLYFFIEKKYDASGLFFGIAFMTRFFVIYAVIPLVLFCIFQLFREKKTAKKISLFIFSFFFLITLIPYLILNHCLYNNIFYPFILQAYMTKNTGWVFYQPFYFYFFGLIKENALILFSMLGVLAVFRKKEPKQILLFLVFIFSFVPFNLIAHKEMRLLLLSLPFAYIMTTHGLVKFFGLFPKKQKVASFLLILLTLVWILQTAYQLKFDNYEDGFDAFYSYVKTAKISGPLWVSNPAFIAYSNYKAELIYYPNFNNEKIKELNFKIFNATHILINTCDMPCPPVEPECEQNKAELIKKIKNSFKTAYSKKVWECEHYIFEKS